MNAPEPRKTMLSEALVRRALAEAGGRRPADALADILGVQGPDFARACADYFGLRPVSVGDLRGCKPDFDTISFVEASQRMCATVIGPDRQLLVVIADPLDTRTRTWIARRLQQKGGPRRTEWALASLEDMRAWLVHVERSVRALDSVAVEQEESARKDDAALSVSITDISASQSPTVRLLDSTIHDALKSDASDIHLETQRMGLVIKYRIDGVLVEIRRVDGLEAAHQVLSRIKVVAELDIAERRVPQDGRFKVKIGKREIDLRVSIMPNLFGEDAVLRVLDRDHLHDEARQIRLDNLGFEGRVLQFIRDAAAMPHGLLLVTGPTGSGKTTTLYAALSEINTGIDKIITIEDPVEYQVADVLQIPVNEKKGLTFARGLRSILRHDPDKIMVGEIRDPETAQIAVQAALTGHQVFTTVHANNVFDVMGRFANMGVDTYSFVSALSGIVAQRLVRLNCPRCAGAYMPAKEVLARAAMDPAAVLSATFRRGEGCGHCRGTGYKGRRAVAEILPMSDRLRDLLGERAPLSKIKAAAREQGFVPLRDTAIAAALAGDTTLEEINRVTTVE